MAAIQTEADLQATEAGRLLLDAVCMQYLALGEAVKQLDKLTGSTLQDQFSEHHWKGIMGFRDVLAHPYFNVDLRQVLWMMREALPQLQTTLRTVLDSLQKHED